MDEEELDELKEEMGVWASSLDYREEMGVWASSLDYREKMMLLYFLVGYAPDAVKRYKDRGSKS